MNTNYNRGPARHAVTSLAATLLMSGGLALLGLGLGSGTAQAGCVPVGNTGAKVCTSPGPTLPSPRGVLDIPKPNIPDPEESLPDFSRPISG